MTKLNSSADPIPGRLYFTAAASPEAQDALQHFIQKYGQATPKEADYFIVLGGDGFMLRTLHQFLPHQKPIYGINYGSVGFLLNAPAPSLALFERLKMAQATHLSLLKIQVVTITGKHVEVYAFNEVSLLRQTHQTAKIAISIDGKMRLNELICDGILLATPAGSTAYNFSAYGPILPIDAKLFALTPISAFRPRRWRGALLPHNVIVTLRVLDAKRRPVSAVADGQEVRDVEEIHIKEDPTTRATLLFDAHHNLEERILNEQFYGL